MSLNVYLTQKQTRTVPSEAKIFIREGGAMRELTRAEWDERFPGKEPVVMNEERDEDDGEVFWRNITHNLNEMAAKAGVYDAMWRPNEHGMTKAFQLIEPLRAGLVLLRSDPDRFKAFNPENGWGSYDGLVNFVAAYLHACEEYPEAEVMASR